MTYVCLAFGPAVQFPDFSNFKGLKSFNFPGIGDGPGIARCFAPLCVQIARGFKGSGELDLLDARIRQTTSKQKRLVRLEFFGY